MSPSRTTCSPRLRCNEELTCCPCGTVGGRVQTDRSCVRDPRDFVEQDDAARVLPEMVSDTSCRRRARGQLRHLIPEDATHLGIPPEGVDRAGVGPGQVMSERSHGRDRLGYWRNGGSDDAQRDGHTEPITRRAIGSLNPCHILEQARRIA